MRPDFGSEMPNFEAGGTTMTTKHRIGKIAPCGIIGHRPLGAAAQKSNERMIEWTNELRNKQINKQTK